MTWRWNAFSMRLTPTRPSRTSKELRREGIPAASCPDHVGSGDPILQAALLAVEAHPQGPEERRRDAVPRVPVDGLRQREARPAGLDRRNLRDPGMRRRGCLRA